MKKNLLVLKPGEREIHLPDNHRIICNIVNSWKKEKVKDSVVSDSQQTREKPKHSKEI